LAGADIGLRQEGNTLVCEGQVYTKYQAQRVRELLKSSPNIPYSIRLAKVPMYQVKEGDYLAKIAKRLYGDADKWEYIRYENNQRITNKDSIEPGWMLVVPAEVP